MQAYDHTQIEKKWQDIWEKEQIFAAVGPDTKGDSQSGNKKKFFSLIEFPYPSGDGLHVGHIRSNTAMDIISHKRRREGYDVLYPIGWDAFGLPAENYAIKTGIQPAIITKRNSDNFRRQLKALGFSFDWNREIDTTDPAYYKWTQWIFLRFLKAGLAYKKKMTINWCPKDLIGLANEEVIDGKCERCGTAVEKREKEQWMLAITKYADRLHDDLDTLDYLPQIKAQQRNWIGRSEGVNFKCRIKDLGIEVTMYNSVPQTYCAETFTVIAPEHPLVKELVKGTAHEKPVLELVEKIKRNKLEKGFDIDNDLEGIFTGRYIENYAGTGKDLPIWVASYVLADYGSGIVNCSAHDERDYAFAKKYGIPLHEVVEPLTTNTMGEDAFRAGEPVVERNAAVCVIKHWSEDKYLCLDWKKAAWHGFVVGGIEAGEDPIEAGMREIAEETGYINAKFEKMLGGTIHARFYQPIKKQNRLAHFKPMLFILKDGERKETAQEEKDLHDIKWLTPKEVDAFITLEDMKRIWERARGIEKPVIKNGILLEPKEFAGREWNEVRADIIDHLVKKGHATRAVNYRLRDWIFSRQRYWGEPIPVVHCKRCGIVPLPEKDLPLVLPPVENYRPTETGESPLAAISEWVNTKCPRCIEEKDTIKHLIFDFDGVLGDTWEASVKAGMTLDGGVTKEESEKRLKDYFEKKPNTARGQSRTPEEIEKTNAWIKHWGKELMSRNPALFKDFIDEVKKLTHVKLAVVSSGSNQYIVPMLKESGLDFTHILTFEDHHSKEEKIEQICKDWNVGVKDVYYFTDTKADVYELEDNLDKTKIIGCAWGFHGYEKLNEVLPEKQILKKHTDIHDFFNVSCDAQRETDTMPNWAGSSWYYLRYTDPKNTAAFASPENLKYWTPVDWYNGGMEHTTLHLLYSRFWHKFLFDQGLVPTAEPYHKRTSHGLILAKGGEKMSKSKGNVVNPDGIVVIAGADSLRLYEMFMGPFEQAIAWDENGIVGCRRFVERLWKLREKVAVVATSGNDMKPEEETESMIHRTIKKVSDDIETLRFNTAVSALMIAVNDLEKKPTVSLAHYETILLLVAPFTPHVAEEIWHDLGHTTSIHREPWPTFDPAKLVEKSMTIAVQINGKTRALFEVRNDEVEGMDEARIEAYIQQKALTLDGIKDKVYSKDIKKFIYVKGRLLNIVVAM